MKDLIYEKIYLGASLSVLIKLFFEKKNVLVIEKENYFGGAWKIGSGKYKNLDLACHLLVPSSKKEGIKISNFFSKFKLNVREVFKKEFYADSKKWKSYGKNGPAMICNEGWPKMLNVFKNLTTKKKNIKIIKDLKVNRLVLQNKVVKVLTKDKTFLAKQVLFPSYSSLKYFYFKNKKEFLPRQKITNYHFLITLKCRSNLLVKNFQCFYSKKSKYLFDRLSVSFIRKKKIPP